MYNQITLLGNLTKDGELKYTSGGTAIYSNSIATSHKYTSNNEKKEETCFIDLTAMGKQGEICNQYLRKGSKVLIVGRLKLDCWNGQDGQKHSKHSVMVETMKMMDGKQDSQSSNGQTNQAPQQGGYGQNQQHNAQSNQTNHTAYREPPRMPDRSCLPEIDIDDSQIPF